MTPSKIQRYGMHWLRLVSSFLEQAFALLAVTLSDHRQQTAQQSHGVQFTFCQTEIRRGDAWVKVSRWVVPGFTFFESRSQTSKLHNVHEPSSFLNLSALRTALVSADKVGTVIFGPEGVDGGDGDGEGLGEACIYS